MSDFADVPPLITLEEHYIAPPPYQAISDLFTEQYKDLPPRYLTKLKDLGPTRLSDMDAGGVSLQVLSHVSGLGTFDTKASQSANDHIASKVISSHPTRYAGLAVLPMIDPVAAANEFRRAVKELGFCGALVDNHVDGKYFDGKEYDVFWATAQELDVPVYLHPNWPTEEMAKQYQPAKGTDGDSFSHVAALVLSISGFGWHVDTALHMLRLFAAGVFDRFPKLKIVVGHFGETLPILLGRIETTGHAYAGHLKRSFGEVYRENVWITTSGVWNVDPIATILRNTPIDHIMYSIDYPFSENTVGLQFIRDLKDSGLVTQEQLEKICFKNAEALLRVKAPQRT